MEGAELPSEDSSSDSVLDSDVSSDWTDSSSDDRVEDSSDNCAQDSFDNSVEEDLESSSDEGAYPKFRWNKDMNMWEVSYDNGKSWILLEEKKDSASVSGCGSMLFGSELPVMLLFGGALLMKKRKRK